MRSPRSTFLLIAALALAACGPRIVETRAAPQVVIRLTQTRDTTAGCIDAAPSPAVVTEGQPFQFENTTTVDLELIRLDNEKTFTKIRAGRPSASLSISGLEQSGRFSYYSKGCAPSYKNALGQTRHHYQIRSITVMK